jgi:hypothetical protein
MRALLIAAALVVAAPAASASSPAPGRVEFEVTRNGQPFGRHVVTVTGSGETLRSHSSVWLRAGVGPLTVFRYEQTCAETWTGERLAAIECSTLKDGRRLEIRGAVRGGRVVVAGASGEQAFPSAVLPTSWWRRPTSGVVSLLDTETGAPMTVTVTEHGSETINVGGRAIRADRIRVQGEIAVDLWYDDQGRWIGCRFTARGQTIEYRVTALA